MTITTYGIAHEPALRKTRIWDLPIRFFHWMLAASFLTALSIATLADGEGTLFPYHALAGLMAVFLVALRIVWGVFGSRWTRFSAFELRPSALVRYLGGALAGSRSTRSAGHNAATSWFALATIAIVAGLGVTGFMLGRGNEAIKEVHEVLAWSMLALVGVHVAGVAWHSLRHRENLAASMVSGHKLAEPEAAIRSVRPWSAAMLLVLAAAFAATLNARYDRTTKRLTLPVLSSPLQLGESEGQSEAGGDTGDDDEHQEAGDD